MYRQKILLGLIYLVGIIHPRSTGFFFSFGKIEERPHWLVSCNFRWYLFSFIGTFFFPRLVLIPKCKLWGTTLTTCSHLSTQVSPRRVRELLLLTLQPFILTYKPTSPCLCICNTTNHIFRSKLFWSGFVSSLNRDRKFEFVRRHKRVIMVDPPTTAISHCQFPLGQCLVIVNSIGFQTIWSATWFTYDLGYGP